MIIIMSYRLRRSRGSSIQYPFWVKRNVRKDLGVYRFNVHFERKEMYEKQGRCTSFSLRWNCVFQFHVSNFRGWIRSFLAGKILGFFDFWKVWRKNSFWTLTFDQILHRALNLMNFSFLAGRDGDLPDGPDDPTVELLRAYPTARVLCWVHLLFAWNRSIVIWNYWILLVRTEKMWSLKISAKRQNSEKEGEGRLDVHTLSGLVLDRIETKLICNQTETVIFDWYRSVFKCTEYTITTPLHRSKQEKLKC